jgi:Insertion element 4 transposase N-terminal/Transposase DDE domain
VILPVPPKKPTSFAALCRRVETALSALPPADPGRCLDHGHAAALHLYCPLPLVLSILDDTGRQSRHRCRLPADRLVYFVIACSLWRDKSLPNVWLRLHPLSDQRQPDPSAFVHARKRLGVRPLRALFRRLVCSAGPLPGASYKSWRLLALDGSIFELPDTPDNREEFGSASNQHGVAAFPQMTVLALCEVLTHAVIDFEAGRYDDSELALSGPLLQRLPEGSLVLMDRGLSYFGPVRAIKARGGEVLARVKVSRALPVGRVLADGSYLSTIYPDFNAGRRKQGGVAVRVVCYSHDDPDRGGCDEQTVLLTTVLDPEALSAGEAVRLYPWRWAEESVLAEVKTVMQRAGAPLLRSKLPGLVWQELYGLLLAHHLTRRAMAEAAQLEAVAAWRLSFTDSLEVLRKWLSEERGQAWRGRYRLLLSKVAEKKLRGHRERSYPRYKKAARQKWPMKKAGQPPPKQPGKPLAEALYILVPPAAAGQEGSGP